jgi:hypothetical protein
MLHIDPFLLSVFEKGGLEQSVYYSPTYVPIDGDDQVTVMSSPHISVMDAGVGQIHADTVLVHPHHETVEIEDVTDVDPSDESFDPPSQFASDGGDHVISLRPPGVQTVDERTGSIRPGAEFKARLSALLQSRGEPSMCI